MVDHAMRVTRATCFTRPLHCTGHFCGILKRFPSPQQQQPPHVLAHDSSPGEREFSIPFLYGFVTEKRTTDHSPRAYFFKPSKTDPTEKTLTFPAS